MTWEVVVTDKEDENKPISFNEYRNRPKEETYSTFEYTSDGTFLRFYVSNGRMIINIDAIGVIMDNTGHPSLPPQTRIVNKEGQMLLSLTTNCANELWEIIYDARRRRR